MLDIIKEYDNMNIYVILPEYKHIENERRGGGDEDNDVPLLYDDFEEIKELIL